MNLTSLNTRQVIKYFSGQWLTENVQLDLVSLYLLIYVYVIISLLCVDIKDIEEGH